MARRVTLPPFQVSGGLMPSPPCPCSSTLPLTHTGPCQLPLNALSTAGDFASTVSPPGLLHPPCPGWPLTPAFSILTSQGHLLKEAFLGHPL